MDERLKFTRLSITTLVAVGLVIAYAIAPFVKFWVLDAAGAVVPVDFLSFWTAGKLAAQGAVASVYSFDAMAAAERHVVGHEFPGFFCWLYPPTFLFVAVVLSWFPYAVAYALWIVTTGAVFAASVAKIAGKWNAGLIALATPWALTNISIGQNGFLSAALAGTGLVCLPKRPVLAGVFFGLLTFKPQLGILIPIALVAGQYWRTVLAAAVTALVFGMLAGLVFGFDTWGIFLHGLPVGSNSILQNGSVGFNLLGSPYSLLRELGSSAAVAWAMQGVVTLAAAVAIAIVWRRPGSLDLKCAALLVASILATPFVQSYDMTALVAALAFLHRDRRLSQVEFFLAAAVMMIFMLRFFGIFPNDPILVAVIGSLIARRLLDQNKRNCAPALAR